MNIFYNRVVLHSSSDCDVAPSRKLPRHGATVPWHVTRQFECHPSVDEPVSSDRCQLRRTTRGRTRRVVAARATPEAPPCERDGTETAAHIPRLARPAVGGRWRSSPVMATERASAARQDSGTLNAVVCFVVSDGWRYNVFRFK